MEEVKHDDKWLEDHQRNARPGQFENPTGPTEVEEAQDALSPQIAPGLTLIVNMRLYDVMMGIYRHFDEERADALYELHARGGLLGAEPHYDPDVEL